MKTTYKIALVSALLSLCGPAFAQKPTTGCIDVNVQGQADGIKLGLTKQGHTLYQEAMFNMTSMEPVPIAVKMITGVQYQMIYVGSESSNRMIFELYDGKDKKLDEKVERGANNSIVYTYTPKKTDIYLVTLIQKKGTKDMCGYFGVMMKGAHPPVAATSNQPADQPAPPPTAPEPAKKAKVKTATTVKRATTVKKTNTPKPAETKVAPSESNNYQNMPANQRPNPNRTRATREAQQQRGR